VAGRSLIKTQQDHLETAVWEIHASIENWERDRYAENDLTSQLGRQ